MMRKFAIVAAAAIAALAAAYALLPSTQLVERSIVIAAPAERVFAFLNGFQHYNSWSPWADIDPDATFAYEGPPTGVGATMTWTIAGLGSGRQEIVEAAEPRLIRLRVSFGNGAVSDTTFAMAPADGGTRVTWRSETPAGLSPLARWQAQDTDARFGPVFDAGLQRMKAFVEKQACRGGGAAETQMPVCMYRS